MVQLRAKMIFVLQCVGKQKASTPSNPSVIHHYTAGAANETTTCLSLQRLAYRRLPPTPSLLAIQPIVEFTTTIRSSKNEAKWRGIDTISGDEIGKGDISIGMSLDT